MSGKAYRTKHARRSRSMRTGFSNTGNRFPNGFQLMADARLSPRPTLFILRFCQSLSGSGSLPRFQRTRGILRLLALWVSKAYQEGFKGAHRDPLIGIGTAPLEDPMFRAALFEQLGEPRLEGAITTDICGKKDSHAIRLDKEAVESIQKARLHRKAATTIFFESNGGQTRVEATVPEIRLAVAEPSLDIGNVETVLESLTEACYYLTVERTRYHFSLKENLNKRFADRRASIQPPKIDERARTEIQRVFSAGSGLKTSLFSRAERPNTRPPGTHSGVLDRISRCRTKRRPCRWSNQ